MTWEKVNNSLYYVYSFSSEGNRKLFNGRWKNQKAIPISVVLSNRFGLAYSERYSNYKMQDKDSSYYKMVLSFESLYEVIVRCLKKRRNLEIVDSLESFDKQIGNFPFFRGHADFTYKLVPSLFRKRYKENERSIFREFVETCPEELIAGKTNYEKLCLMQHYGLPTRLLDITTDKYVALYMACTTVFGQASDINLIGSVLAFDGSNQAVNADRVEDYITSTVNGGKDSKLGFVNLKWPCFIQYKKMSDNYRLDKQKGSFIVFGSPDDSVTNFKTLYIINKRKILEDLSLIGYNEKTLLPELEHICHYIKQKYE